VKFIVTPSLLPLVNKTQHASYQSSAAMKSTLPLYDVVHIANSHNSEDLNLKVVINQRVCLQSFLHSENEKQYGKK